MKVEAPFVACPTCKDVVITTAATTVVKAYCETCNGTGKVYKLPDPLLLSRAKVEWDVVAIVGVAFIMLAYFLLKGIWP